MYNVLTIFPFCSVLGVLKLFKSKLLLHFVFELVVRVAGRGIAVVEFDVGWYVYAADAMVFVLDLVLLMLIPIGLCGIYHRGAPGFVLLLFGLPCPRIAEVAQCNGWRALQVFLSYFNSLPDEFVGVGAEPSMKEHLMFVDLGLCWSWRVGFDSIYCMLALMLNGSRPALHYDDGAFESLLLCRSCQLNLIYHIDAGSASDVGYCGKVISSALLNAEEISCSVFIPFVWLIIECSILCSASSAMLVLMKGCCWIWNALLPGRHFGMLVHAADVAWP
ncbi:hypothetical protein Nepgr_004041 [Nepenthes gracilis]|uniref:Uncharacterized protein n=1 Tax=Nepenthes gracilis TaxID=150966 RepID=A0AAD3XEM7_NEPGR|nr:hypothetical protein Nepgr_004041 [Nepenthes gracilis]